MSPATQTTAIITAENGVTTVTIRFDLPASLSTTNPSTLPAVALIP
jgi:hypothetical protein